MREGPLKSSSTSLSVVESDPQTEYTEQLTDSTNDYSSGAMNKKFSKLSYLRDLMWIRETQEDLTAAEFAISLDQTVENPKRQKRTVDFDNLLAKLNRRMMDMGCEPNSREVCEIDKITGVPVNNNVASLVYSDEMRKDIFNRILQTRYALMETMKNQGGDVEDDPFSISLPQINIDIPKQDESSDGGSKIYVRDDGTVDWDGSLQDKEALINLGSAVWARINGRDPDVVSDDEVPLKEDENNSSDRQHRKEVTAKIEETDEIRQEKERLSTLQSTLLLLEKEHLALLNSAISAGQAVANINLATLKPELRRKIDDSSNALEQKREEVMYQQLIYELERIFTYLSTELSNSSVKGYIPLQDRLNIAEFGLLESQINSLRKEDSGSLVDRDVLAVVSDQVTDFKRRLGIDYYVVGLTFDREAIQTYLNELFSKITSVVLFIVKGCKLLWNDLIFAFTLILRAAGGYTLKPREVRNLRRTFKDLITFIPFAIIFLIPLSPVGHALVFAAIQRVFPEFFPTCFREERQNLLQLYETTEYSELTINENFRDKVVRILEAFFFQIASNLSKFVSHLKGEEEDDSPPKP
eukprot:CAMPEP_0178910176 /NCGR_PEP_ID=MMETSP0786-20121207/8948_1 /TAXON_ID=186022 /ORGANISM="Thalassionema frauenfeldii, Strain CCMP 1798" /LENGTH=582 /DNA_ID=CAMNT_0020582391 /DNA_START=221 /DNA_END=1969 /DNA_ORIENTATION=+